MVWRPRRRFAPPALTGTVPSGPGRLQPRNRQVLVVVDGDALARIKLARQREGPLTGLLHQRVIRCDDHQTAREKTWLEEAV